jgi:hypothetical protein
VIEALIHRVKLRQTELKEAMADGVPMSWEAYKVMVGQYQGLQLTLDMIDNMLEEDREDKGS